jgi:molybdopterin-binding protein
MSGAMLSVQGIRRSFAGSQFQLRVDELTAKSSETLVLLGPSGSGKTTLLNVIGLLESPDEGSVLLGGVPVTRADREQRNRMAAVFQRPYLFRGDIADNVGYGLRVRGIRGTERDRRIASALERVGLSGWERRSTARLSGGEAQRVSLARALAIEPAVLLLDEPLASLDPLLRRRLTSEFSAIVHETGATVVWVTHDQEEALAVADKVAIMNGGAVVAWGSAEQTMGVPADEWTAAFLGMQAAIPARVVSSEDGLVGLETGGGAVVFATGLADVGADALFAVRPEDVLLFEAGVELPPTTARNRLPARVIAAEPRGATVEVTLGMGGARVAASVSRSSAAELGVVPGADVQAVFKATAVRWRPGKG